MFAHWLYGEIEITKKEAAIGYHSGACDDDVLWLSQQPKIKRQLLALDPEKVREHLAQYGAWDDEELLDHEQNLQRFLWNCCADIIDR